MLARLGHVLGGLGQLIGGLFWIAAVGYLFIQKSPGFSKSEEFFVFGLFAIIGIVFWGIGRALRYILSGD